MIRWVHAGRLSSFTLAREPLWRRQKCSWMSQSSGYSWQLCCPALKWDFFMFSCLDNMVNNSRNKVTNGSVHDWDAEGYQRSNFYCSRVKRDTQRVTSFILWSQSPNPIPTRLSRTNQILHPKLTVISDQLKLRMSYLSDAPEQASRQAWGKQTSLRQGGRLIYSRVNYVAQAG